jgi:hypothetical protein
MKVENRTMKTIKITTGISTTKKSAQSKKCRLLAKVSTHETHYRIALAIRLADQLLSEVMSEDEVRNAWDNQVRSGRGRNNSARITIELNESELEAFEDMNESELENEEEFSI